MIPYYEPWTEAAVCREVGGDEWFPEKGGDWKTPSSLCLTQCMVRLQCLDFAMRHEVGMTREKRFGILGGLTPRKRAEYEPVWLGEQEVSAA
ncbi:WhiB family transcriptional regulator [Streptomyces sp.]|uniref:WhiB family transcriptional regulator n=1 Tax=Streptomyces sp. TaxID=1931 RepID=UPI002F924C71